MEKINIDRKITERADEFAEREYVCGADERAHLSKGYYWGYKDAQKDLALTWIDIRNILSIAREVEDENDDCPLLKSELCDEILRRFNEQRKK